ncbi:MAG: galactose mutarotase [Bacteroidales bacterium]|nr:galactose mutarotase [Bacteroidales bacterium]
MTIRKEHVSFTEEGEHIFLFTLENGQGIRVNILNYGGIITQIFTPDKYGLSADILFGPENIQDYFSEQYRENCHYFGATIGRYCNRIRDSKFRIGTTDYILSSNDGLHHLHGGCTGFDKAIWEPETHQTENTVALILKHFSPDGDQGYPGNLRAKVTFTLNDSDELITEYECTADRTTPVNLTNHSYFNLAGDLSKDILNHEICIPAGHFTENGPGLIPTGRFTKVENTVFDFRKSSVLKEKISGLPGGIDLNYILDHGISGDLKPAVRVSEKISGRVLEIFTTQPGIQLFTLVTGPYPIKLKGNPDPGQFAGLALEPQHFPDSPNHGEFPDTLLRPGEVYNQKNIYRFSTL